MFASRLGLVVLTSLAAAVVGCSTSADEDSPSTTSSSDVVVGQVALGWSVTGPFASPDGRYLAFARVVGSNTEVVRVDLSTSPPKEEVVQSEHALSGTLRLSPKGSYFYLTNTSFHRTHVMSWDLSVHREVRGTERISISDDDRWLFSHTELRTSVDGSFAITLDGAALELATGKVSPAKTTVPTYDVSFKGAPTFSHDGKTVLLRLSDRIVGVDLATGATDTLFSGIGDTEPLLGTYDGDSIAVATSSRSSTWGPHRLVLVHRDGTSTPITDERGLYARDLTLTSQHCILPRGDGLFVMTAGANAGEIALATWDRAAGLVTVRGALGAQPSLGGTSVCDASAAPDGSLFSFVGRSRDAATDGFTTVSLGGAAGATERFVDAPEPTWRGLSADGVTAGRSLNGAVEIFALRDGAKMATLPAGEWWRIPRVGDDFLTIEEDFKAVFRTGKATHREVFRTTDRVIGVVPIGDSRAGAIVWRSNQPATLVVFTL